MSTTDTTEVPTTNSEGVTAIFQAVQEIQNDTSLTLTRTRTGQVQSRTYKYLPIDKLHDAVFPKLKEHGLAWITRPTFIMAEGGFTPALTYELVHCATASRIQGTMPLCLAKQDPQGLGSAITYARRYALLAVLGLIGDNDDDGAEGSGQEPTERPAIPPIPIDRAKRILEAAQAAGLAEGTELKPALIAKLTEVGVETGKLGHLNVDQAASVEHFIQQEAQ